MRRRWRQPYERLQLVSLLALALLPLLVFGLVAVGRLDFLTSANADAAARTALDSVASVLQQRQRDLANNTQRYATWSELQDHAAPLDAAWVRESVLDFVVSRNIADAAVLRAGGETVSAGAPGLTGAVSDEVGRFWQGEARTLSFAQPDGVYALAMWPATATAGSAGAPVLAFAERVDETFVSGAKALTGWDVAIAGADGQIRVATARSRFEDVAPPAASPTAAPELTWTRQSGGFAGGSAVIVGADGAPVGALMVATDLGALSNLSSQVLAMLAVILGPTILGALLLSLFLTIRIRRRLAVIENGIAAVASGDLSVRLPTSDRDAFERLASSHNRLAAALERRDTMLAQLLDALAGLTPDSGVAGVAIGGVAAARRIFGLAWCELRSADDSVVVEGRPKKADARAHEIDVPHGEEFWRLLYGGRPEGWSAAEDELLELFTIQLGSALRDAELYEKTANRAKSLDRNYRLQADFLRGVSHNLQSPLTAIVGLSDDLQSESRLDEAALKRAAVIHAEAQRLSRLVRQLLTMSRLEAGTLQVVAELCAPEPIIRRAWRALRSDRELRLHNEADGALAVADAQALEQVLWIVLDNAVRYAPTGPITVDVSVRPRASRRRSGSPRGAPDRELVIRVEDEGPGVPLAERSRIFRRFQRGSTSAGHEGTGLGLDVARGVLRAMDGTVVCEAGRVGAAFVMTLPAEVADAPV